MQKIFKIHVAFFAALLLFMLPCTIWAESVILETPAPARTHTPPAPTPEPPPVINRTNSKIPAPDVRFRVGEDFLHIWFPDISNADEAVLMLGDEVVLIDCGDKTSGAHGAKLLEYLGVSRIDRLFNSHPHHDHINGLAATHKAAPVKELLVCFPPDATKHMENALKFCANNGISVSEYKDGDVFTMGDGAVTLTFWVGSDPDLDMNNNSAATMVQFGSRRILFTADLENPGLEALLAAHPAGELQADILKYPHHGKRILPPAFYEAVNPAFAVVTNQELDWPGMVSLAARKIPRAFTGGPKRFLHLYTDGNAWVVEYVPYK